MFSRTLMELLQERGISAYKLSKDTGIKQSTISQWKLNRQKPSADALERLSRYFNVSADYLLYGTDEKSAEEQEEHSECEVEISDDVKELLAVYQQLDTSGKRQLMGKAYELLDKRG